MPPPSSNSQWAKPLLGSSDQPLQLQQQRMNCKLAYEQQLQEEFSRIKIVLVGDGAVGKTSLIVSYTRNGFPPEYEPTAFDNYNVVVNVNGQPISIQLCDTAGQDDFDPLRSLCYPEADVFLICFSIVNPTSYYRVATKWINEVYRHCPNTPVILVGTKSDLRSDVRLALQLARYGQTPISTSQGHQLANKIGASSYVETSALTQKDLKEAFDQAIVSALSLKQGGTQFLLNHKKPPSFLRKWFCCWEKSSSTSSS